MDSDVLTTDTVNSMVDDVAKQPDTSRRTLTVKSYEKTGHTPALVGPDVDDIEQFLLS